MLADARGFQCRVAATGGLAQLIAVDSETIEEVYPDLTLDGIYRIWKDNVKA